MTISCPFSEAERPVGKRRVPPAATSTTPMAPPDPAVRKRHFFQNNEHCTAATQDTY